MKTIERVQMWLWTLCLFGASVLLVQLAIVDMREARLNAAEAAQDAKMPSAPPSTTATEPKLSDAAHAKIRDLQLQQKTIENQYLQMQQQLANLEKQFNALTGQLTAETDAAYKEAGAKREEWTLDMAALKFTKVEKPKPEEKKPDAKKP